MSSSLIFDYLTSSLVGFGFGWSLTYGRVHIPEFIIDQMRFKKFIMLKMFLSAVSSSLLVHGVLSIFFKKKFALFRKQRKDNTSYLATAIGAGILGAGMSVSGSCPGTVFAQLGSGLFKNAGSLFAGACLGVLTYSILLGKETQSFLGKWKSNGAGANLNNSEKIIDNDQKKIAYWKIALPLSLMMAGVVFALEKYRPWYIDLGLKQAPFSLSEIISSKQPGSFTSIFASPWPPYLAGALIGLSQLPMLLRLNKPIGSSSSYVTVTGSCCSLLSTNLVQSKAAYLKSKMAPSNYNQVFQMISAAIGGYAASTLLGDFGQVSTDVSLGRSFLGGFLLLFGARLASGCTSGHGISGFSQLYKASFFAVPAMFGVGILTAQFLG